jgi:hypothetical protein
VNEEGFLNGIFFELVTDSGTISVQSNVSMSTPWYAYNYHVEDHLTMAPMETLVNHFVMDEQTEDHVFDNEGNFVATTPITAV